MKKETATIYIAEDGKIFKNETECLNYEETILADTYEVEAIFDVVLRLDGVKAKFLMKSANSPDTANTKEYNNFLDKAYDELFENNTYLTAKEVFTLAAQQNIFPYVEHCENEHIFNAVKIKEKKEAE